MYFFLLSALGCPIPLAFCSKRKDGKITKEISPLSLAFRRHFFDGGGVGNEWRWGWGTLPWALSTVLQPPAGTARASLPRWGKPGLPLVLRQSGARDWGQGSLSNLVSLRWPTPRPTVCTWPVAGLSPHLVVPGFFFSFPREPTLEVNQPRQRVLQPGQPEPRWRRRGVSELLATESPPAATERGTLLAAKVKASVGPASPIRKPLRVTGRHLSDNVQPDHSSPPQNI